MNGGIFDTIEADKSTDDSGSDSDSEAGESDVPNESPESASFDSNSWYRSPEHKEQGDDPDNIGNKGGGSGGLNDFLFMVEAHDIIGADE